jgi:hypothetical protein
VGIPKGLSGGGLLGRLGAHTGEVVGVIVADSVQLGGATRVDIDLGGVPFDLKKGQSLKPDIV